MSLPPNFVASFCCNAFQLSPRVRSALFALAFIPLIQIECITTPLFFLSIFNSSFSNAIKTLEEIHHPLPLASAPAPLWKAFLAAAPVALSSCWLWYHYIHNQNIRRISSHSRRKVIDALSSITRDSPSSQQSLATLCCMCDYLSVVKLLSNERHSLQSCSHSDTLGFGEDDSNFERDIGSADNRGWCGKVRHLWSVAYHFICPYYEMQAIIFFQNVQRKPPSILFFNYSSPLQDIEIALHAAIGRLIFSKSPAMQRVAYSKPVLDPQPYGAKSFTAKLFAIIPLTLHLHIQLVASFPL